MPPEPAQERRATPPAPAPPIPNPAVRDERTERLRDAIYAMRDRGLLPHWHPDMDVVLSVPTTR